MKLNNNNRMGTGTEMTPDPRIRSMLESISPQEDVLPWSSAVALIDNAPAVKAPWYLKLTYNGRRQLAYASLPAVLLVILGTLWSMPAQSNYLGTIMTTGLPSSWQANSLEVAEVQNMVFSDFEDVKPEYGELFFKVTEGEGRPRLALAMIGLDRESAEALVSSLEMRYPALQAFSEEYTDISSDHYRNRLDEIISGLQHKLNGSTWKSTDELKLHVLNFMKQSGFSDVNAQVIKGDNGKLYIEVDAAFKFEVPGRTQEALNSAGLDEEVLGRQVYEQLLSELGN